MITVVVLAHELGHLVAAKKAGIGVDDFGIGMGPKIFQFKKGETTYGIHLFPIGGFVNLTGVDGGTEPTKIDPGRNFNLKPFKARFMAIFSGPLANYILALGIFFLVFWLVGVPDKITNQISTIKPGSPAEQAGLKPGDYILELDHQKVTDMEKAINKIHLWPPGKKLTLTAKRDSSEFTVSLVPEFIPKRKLSYLGFSPKVALRKYGIFKAFFKSLKETYSVTLGVLY